MKSSGEIAGRENKRRGGVEPKKGMRGTAVAHKKRNRSLFIKETRRRVVKGRDQKRGLQKEQKYKNKILSDQLVLGTLQTFLSMKQGLI